MSTYPAFAAGDRVTAQLLNDMQSSVIVATTAQTINNSATFVNDATLVVPVLANANYVIEFFVMFSQGGATLTADVKTEWTAPAGTAALKQVTGPTDGNAVDPAQWISRVDTGARVSAHLLGTTVIYNLDTSANGSSVIWESALVNVDGSAGNVTFRWAQNAATAQNLTRDAFSFARYTRLQ